MEILDIHTFWCRAAQPEQQNQLEEQTQPTTTEKKIIENPKTLDRNNISYFSLGIIGLIGILGLDLKYIKKK